MTGIDIEFGISFFHSREKGRQYNNNVFSNDGLACVLVFTSDYNGILNGEYACTFSGLSRRLRLHCRWMDIIAQLLYHLLYVRSQHELHVNFLHLLQMLTLYPNEKHVQLLFGNYYFRQKNYCQPNYCYSHRCYHPR